MCRAGGALTMNGAGTLDLTNTNTFTGALNLNGGVVQASADANLGYTVPQINFNAKSCIRKLSNIYT